MSVLTSAFEDKLQYQGQDPRCGASHKQIWEVAESSMCQDFITLWSFVAEGLVLYGEGIHNDALSGRIAEYVGQIEVV